MVGQGVWVLSCYRDLIEDYHCHAHKEKGFCAIKGKEFGGKGVQAESIEEERGGRRKGVKRGVDWLLP